MLTPASLAAYGAWVGFGCFLAIRVLRHNTGHNWLAAFAGLALYIVSSILVIAIALTHEPHPQSTFKGIVDELMVDTLPNGPAADEGSSVDVEEQQTSQ